MNRRILVAVLLIGLHVFVGVTLIPDLALGLFGSVLAWGYLVLSAVLMRYGVLVRGAGSALLAWSGLLAMGIFSSAQFFGVFSGGLLGGAALQTGGAGALVSLLTVLTCIWLAGVWRYARAPAAAL